ncbi:MAG: hypothetical protein A2V63_02630 [Candidatus Eisenbacteria bacterium RBG_19FT_COMBO_70_11]|nr:MAG: hypothetical protein A2V63_02630 [Candidatus Eisenbacteria bacterium RBG_19FT_COMBO_70_11]
MLGRIEEAMSSYRDKGVRWTAKTLTSNVRDSQERRFGADFVGALDIDLPDYPTRKGFLAQAKRVDPGDPFPASRYAELRDQCHRMLELSPDSYVFLYATTGIKVVPANAVVAAMPVNPHALYSRGITSFFELHFSSFVGDRGVSVPSIDVLEDLRTRFEARSVLGLYASQVEPTV